MPNYPIKLAELKEHVDTEEPISALNDSLAPLERILVETFDAPLQPTIFIVGAPRSGTTLLSQLLTAKYEIGYVSNLVARFWKAPYLGMLLMQQIRGDGPPDVGFSSDLGSTSGYEGPHEFGHFWRRWFLYENTHSVSKDRLRKVDVPFLKQECAAMESVEARPFLFKNLVCSFQIDFLSNVFPKAVFVHCRREPIFVAQSLLESRIRYNGSREEWFSVKPEAYETLRERRYPEQIAGQIYHTRLAVERAFDDLPPSRFCRIDYEQIVEHPSRSLQDVTDAVEKNGGRITERQRFSFSELTSTNEKTIDTGEFERLEKACHKFFGYTN